MQMLSRGKKGYQGLKELADELAAHLSDVSKKMMRKSQKKLNQIKFFLAVQELLEKITQLKK